MLQLTVKHQQETLANWLQDRGLANAPTVDAITVHLPPQKEELQSKKTSIYLCHVMESCKEFKRRPREIQQFLKIISALQLKKEHYIVVDPSNIRDKLKLFDIKNIILWGSALNTNENCIDALKSLNCRPLTVTPISEILQNPSLKKEVWTTIQPLKITP